MKNEQVKLSLCFIVGIMMDFFTEKVDITDNVFRISGATTGKRRNRSSDEEFKEYLEHEQERNRDNQEKEEQNDNPSGIPVQQQVSPLTGLDIVDIRLKDVHKINVNNSASIINTNDNLSINTTANEEKMESESEKTNSGTDEKQPTEKRIDELV